MDWFLSCYILGALIIFGYLFLYLRCIKTRTLYNLPSKHLLKMYSVIERDIISYYKNNGFDTVMFMSVEIFSVTVFWPIHLLYVILARCCRFIYKVLHKVKWYKLSTRLFLSKEERVQVALGAQGTKNENN